MAHEHRGLPESLATDGTPATPLLHGRARGGRRSGRGLRRLLSGAIVLSGIAGPACAPVRAAASAAVAPAWTISHYENGARRAALYRQGEAAGRLGAQGIVILDFGRPAERHGKEGTVAYDNRFVPLPAIAAAVERYAKGYFLTAPRDTRLDVAVGTNDSCGTGQPCGAAVCGCVDEPSSFVAWGERLASTVEHVDAWVSALRATGGYSDEIHIVAADDVEPAYDPAYRNTYDVLRGYALAAHGSVPPMVDYGSADPNIWSEAQLYQVAYGFAPDVPMPEIYEPRQAREWAALARYARYRLGRSLTFFGVLAGGGTATGPPTAYTDLLGAVRDVNAQRSLRWLSTLAPLGPGASGVQTG